MVHHPKLQKHRHTDLRTDILDLSGFALINMFELSTTLQIYKYSLSERD